MSKRILAVLLAFLPLAAAAQSAAANAWKARASQALSRKLVARSEVDDKSKTAKADYQAAIEWAYALHAAPDTVESRLHEVVHGTEVFHLLLMAKRGDVFDLAVSYVKGETTPSKLTIVRLPKGWSATAAADPGSVTVTTRTVVMTFSRADPFQVVVSERSP